MCIYVCLVCNKILYIYILTLSGKYIGITRVSHASQLLAINYIFLFKTLFKKLLCCVLITEVPRFSAFNELSNMLKHVVSMSFPFSHLKEELGGLHLCLMLMAS